MQQLSTYYVYDDLGYLAYVIPPGANPESMVMTQATLDNLCYQYWYDERGRLFRKKLPGKGWEFTVYNTLDQVVMTQNAGQRNQTPQQWTFTKYDALGRVIMTGIYTYAGSSADNNVSAPGTAELTANQNLYNTTGNPRWEARTNANATGYDGLSDPTGHRLYVLHQGLLRRLYLYRSAGHLQQTRGRIGANKGVANGIAYRSDRRYQYACRCKLV